MTINIQAACLFALIPRSLLDKQSLPQTFNPYYYVIPIFNDSIIHWWLSNLLIVLIISSSVYLIHYSLTALIFLARKWIALKSYFCFILRPPLFLIPPSQSQVIDSIPLSENILSGIFRSYSLQSLLAIPTIQIRIVLIVPMIRFHYFSISKIIRGFNPPISTLKIYV